MWALNIGNLYSTIPIYQLSVQLKPEHSDVAGV